MYQTLQSTGVCWALHLVVPGIQTIQLGYGPNLKDVLRNIQNCPIHVKNDHILSNYIRNDDKKGLTLIKGNMTKRGPRESWRGSKRTSRTVLLSGRKK